MTAESPEHGALRLHRECARVSGHTANAPLSIVAGAVPHSEAGNLSIAIKHIHQFLSVSDARPGVCREAAIVGSRIHADAPIHGRAAAATRQRGAVWLLRHFPDFRGHRLDSCSWRVVPNQGPEPLETAMSDKTILVRVEDGVWEGWRWMSLDDFLERVSLDAWEVEQVMVGVILPPDRQGMN